MSVRFTPSRNDARGPAPSPRRVLIELDGDPVGVAVAKRGGYEIYAAAPAFAGLEGRTFRRVQSAVGAARRIKAEGLVPPALPLYAGARR